MIDSDEDRVVADAPLIVSLSNIADPLTPVLKTGLVRVLFVKTCEPVRVATVASIFRVIVSVALATEAIPVPPAIVRVLPSAIL